MSTGENWEGANWVVPEEGTPMADAYAVGYEAGQAAERALTTYPLASPEHAFTAGQVAGVLIKAGVIVWPEYDAEGVYQASMSISEDEDSLRLRIVALPPESGESR